MQNTVEFLRRLYGGFSYDGVFVITHLFKWVEDKDAPTGYKKRDKRDASGTRTYRYLLSDIEKLDWGPHLDANARKADIYFGSALRRLDLLHQRGSSRGGKESCILSTCLSIDIDFHYPGAHTSEKLPPGIESVAPVIGIGPDPSILIDSGYGIHPHWVYTDPVVLEGTKKDGERYSKLRARAHAPYVAALQELGWGCDATFTVDRIWRLPGFYNWKIPNTATPPETSVLYGLDGDIPKYDFNTLVPDEAPKRDRKPKPARTVTTRVLKPAYCVEDLPNALRTYAEECYDQSLDPSLDVDGAALLQKSERIRLLLAGESFAEKGSRDNALTQVCGIICYLTKSIEEFSEADIQYITCDLLRPSFQAWVDDSDTDLEYEEDSACAKLQRIKAKDQDGQQAGERALAQALLQKRRDPNDNKASDEVVLNKSELQNYGLIKYGSFTYVWDWPNQRYFGRYIKDNSDLYCVLRKCWPEEDTSCIFKYYYHTDEGVLQDLPVTQLERLYAHPAEESHYSFIVPQTVFDVEKRTLIINPAPLRYDKAEFNPEINEWLELLGGDEHYKNLCIWLAGLNHLDRACAGLYLNGPPGCGKSLFGLGAAQLWSDDVPLYETVSRNFNQTLLQCPVTLIDEGIDADGAGKRSTAAASMVLKRLIARDSHSVNMKGGPLLRLKSYLRFIIAANDDEVLLSGREEKLSKDSARAMGERIVYVKIDDDRARDWLIKHNKGLKGRELTNTWIQGGAFARHVLWLGENVDLPDNRFMIEGTSDAMLHKTMFQGDERNEVFEWLVHFCEAPMKIQARVQKGNHAAEIGNGIVAVNVELTREKWLAFEKDQDRKIIPHNDLYRHIQAIGNRSVQIRIGDSKRRYWEIPFDLILHYAETHDIGDTDRMREFAARDTDITQKIINSSQKEK